MTVTSTSKVTVSGEGVQPGVAAPKVTVSGQGVVPGSAAERVTYSSDVVGVI
jgi:hypothetical protein